MVVIDCESAIAKRRKMAMRMAVETLFTRRPFVPRRSYQPGQEYAI
jgi:citrate lyase beta subunit